MPLAPGGGALAPGEGVVQRRWGRHATYHISKLYKNRYFLVSEMNPSLMKYQLPDGGKAS